MYVIFLGIIPLILLVLFLVYYTRHNVLYWWKKPRKSYVHRLLCHPPTNTFNCPRLSHATTSLRNLLTTKTKIPKENSNKPDDEIFSHNSTSWRNLLKTKKDDTQIESTDPINSNEQTDTKNDKQPVYYKILHLTDKSQNKKTLKKLDRKINKDDIKIANDIDVKVFKPPIKPKPVKPSESKSNVTIVKAGLTSTTNEMLSNTTKNRSRLYSIKNNGN